VIFGVAYALLRDGDAEDRIATFVSGDLVGEMALVTREPRSATVVAETRVRALFVPTAAFDQLAARHLELAVVLTTVVADRLGQHSRDGFGGKLIEQFRILRCIGRGGMSVVYRAHDESTDEVVALKMMSYRLIYDPAALSRFRREAEIVQALDHPNVARLKRLFAAYHTYFLVMELCEGADLQRLVASRGPLPEREVRAVLGQLARALEYVHARGVVHSDLKPGNVMITRDGVVKLMDFGIAVGSLSADDRTRTVHQGVLGTPAFMAPEQLSGQPLDARTDVYAVGCIGYELLTGRRLFDAADFFPLVQQKLTLTLPPVGEIAGGISPELHAFIERAVRVDPAERPASLASLVAWAAPAPAPPPELIAPQGLRRPPPVRVGGGAAPPRPPPPELIAPLGGSTTAVASRDDGTRAVRDGES